MVVKVAQSSLVAPAPVARFSCTVPSVIESVSGSSVNESVIAEASTPSQLFAPWVIETRFNVPLVVTPAIVTEVSRCSESAWASVPTCAALAFPLSPVTSPRSRLPVPVAVNRPGSATEALPETWRSVESVTVSGCRVRLGAVVEKVAQSSLVAPAPVARFSCRAPFVTGDG